MIDMDKEWSNCHYTIKSLSPSKLLPSITKEPIYVQTPIQLHAANLTENQATKQNQHDITFSNMYFVGSLSDTMPKNDYIREYRNDTFI